MQTVVHSSLPQRFSRDKLDVAYNSHDYERTADGVA